MSRFGTRPRPAMNVTPLVDVVLVLLIIFMVVIPMAEQSAKVELPSVFNVDPEAKGKTDPFMLTLTATGELYFEEEPVPPDAMAAKLRAANQREPSRRLVLRADRTARYAAVRELFKACQEVGFPGVSLRVNELDAKSR